MGFGSLCLEGTGLEYVSTDTLLGITGNCKEVEESAFMTCSLHFCIRDGFVVYIAIVHDGIVYFI